MDGHAVVVHVLRQLRLRLRHAQLREDLIDIRIRGDIEIDDHPHVAGVGVDRIHVIHVVHATHLLLDRRRHRLLNRYRVGAGVMRANLNFRRRDLRILRDRQGKDADAADQRHENGDDDRNNRPSDEKR